MVSKELEFETAFQGVGEGEAVSRGREEFPGVSPSRLESLLKNSFACDTEYSNYLRIAGHMVKDCLYPI